MRTASAYFQQDPRLIGIVTGFFLFLVGMAAVANGQVEGFTEPFRSADLSSDETGTILFMGVEEGMIVEQGEVIAKLDDRVQQIQLELAKHLVNSKSALFAAEKTLEKRQAIHDRIKQLIESNNASESELIRAEMELTIAKSKYFSTKEELATREIEVKRAEAQLERRSIVAPFRGWVSKVHRREGEFISPLRAEVVTLVQLDRLFAKFNIPHTAFSSFKVGQAVTLNMNGKNVQATVYSIGVQTDAQSGTVELKLVIENPSLEIRSGEICTLNI